MGYIRAWSCGGGVGVGGGVTASCNHLLPRRVHIRNRPKHVSHIWYILLSSFVAAVVDGAAGGGGGGGGGGVVVVSVRHPWNIDALVSFWY